MPKKKTQKTKTLLGYKPCNCNLKLYDITLTAISANFYSFTCVKIRIITVKVFFWLLWNLLMLRN